jgi:hypothetical protein
LTTLELLELLRNVFLRVRRSRSQNHFIKVKDLALLEAAVVVAIVEVVTDLLRTLAEFAFTLSLELLHLRSARDTKRRDCDASATRRDTVSSNARSGGERQGAGRHT